MKLRLLAAAAAIAAVAGFSLTAGPASASVTCRAPHPGSSHVCHPVVSVTDEGSYVLTASPLKPGEALKLTGGGVYAVTFVVPDGNLNRAVLSPHLPSSYIGDNANFTVFALP